MWFDAIQTCRAWSFPPLTPPHDFPLCPLLFIRLSTCLATIITVKAPETVVLSNKMDSLHMKEQYFASFHTGSLHQNTHGSLVTPGRWRNVRKLSFDNFWHALAIVLIQHVFVFFVHYSMRANRSYRMSNNLFHPALQAVLATTIWVGLLVNGKNTHRLLHLALQRLSKLSVKAVMLLPPLTPRQPSYTHPFNRFQPIQI